MSIVNIKNKPVLSCPLLIELSPITVGTTEIKNTITVALCLNN